MEPAPRRRSLRVRSLQVLRRPGGNSDLAARTGPGDGERRWGKRDREAARGHPGWTRQPPGWAQWWPAARLAPAGAPQITTGARPTHPLTHAVGGGAGPPGGGAGSPACGCCNAPPDPTAAGQDAGAALIPLPHAPATTPAPRPPQLARGRPGGHSHGRARQNRREPNTKLRTDRLPSPGTPYL